MIQKPSGEQFLTVQHLDSKMYLHFTLCLKHWFFDIGFFYNICATATCSGMLIWVYICISNLNTIF
jgi:hypothetical protein